MSAMGSAAGGAGPRAAVPPAQSRPVTTPPRGRSCSRRQPPARRSTSHPPVRIGAPGSTRRRFACSTAGAGAAEDLHVTLRTVRRNCSHCPTSSTQSCAHGCSTRVPARTRPAATRTAGRRSGACLPGCPSSPAARRQRLSRRLIRRASRRRPAPSGTTRWGRRRSCRSAALRSRRRRHRPCLCRCSMWPRLCGSRTWDSPACRARAEQTAWRPLVASLLTASLGLRLSRLRCPLRTCPRLPRRSPW
mmetsp:Transcript_978/g.3276  ORF Transcript_978/g.3276 Transcript_978/m.3276 type:complete len:247 (-) Transcript_978:675-1415(-)